MKVGDKVEVLDEGLATLRRLCPEMPPNHHGAVDRILENGDLLVLFDDTKQVAPYPPKLVAHRESK